MVPPSLATDSTLLNPGMMRKELVKMKDGCVCLVAVTLWLNINP